MQHFSLWAAILALEEQSDMCRVYSHESHYIFIYTHTHIYVHIYKDTHERMKLLLWLFNSLPLMETVCSSVWSIWCQNSSELVLLVLFFLYIAFDAMIKRKYSTKYECITDLCSSTSAFLSFLLPSKCFSPLTNNKHQMRSFVVEQTLLFIFILRLQVI